MFPPNMDALLKSKGIDPNIGKVMFEMKFNQSKGIEEAFVVNVLYDTVAQMPFGLVFKRFENDECR